MSRPKRLTREQKIILSSHGLNPDQWLLIEETEFFLKLIDKSTGRKYNTDKFLRGKRK